MTDDPRRRTIVTVDKDGNPVRQLSLAEVQHGVLQKAGIEWQLYDRRPQRVVCVTAGCVTIIRVPRTGKVHDRCRECRREIRYGWHTDEMKFKYLEKLVAQSQRGAFPKWAIVKNYIRRYAARPPVEWLERVGLR